MVKELDYTKLRASITTDDVCVQAADSCEANDRMIGQERAAAALSFGLNIKKSGYNIYAAGLPGTGKTSFSQIYAGERAASEPTPLDMCYVYNFKTPRTPKAMTLPAGMGVVLREDMEELIDRLRDELPRVFSSKDFETRKSNIVRAYQMKRDDVIKGMTEEAKEQSFGVKTTNSGIYFMPIVDGEVISEEQYEELPQEQKDDISKQSEAIQNQAAEVMREIKAFEKQTRREVEDLEFSIGLFTVGRLTSTLIAKYADYDNISAYLLDVKEDILDNLAEFIDQGGEEDDSMQSILPWLGKRTEGDFFAKYKINLLTDNSAKKGAPVVVDFNPTYSNLVGEIEYDNEYGNLTTDFMKIKPGLLHKANGGYLILQAYDVFANVHSWETIRCALLTREVIIEPLREYTTGFAVSGIKPEPFKVDVKIIMVGSGFYYDLLYQYDDAFQKLFKVRADFDYEMRFGCEAISETACFVKTYIANECLRAFDCGAVARIVEYSTRLAESQRRLTTRFSRLGDMLVEADAFAGRSGAAVVTEEHVLGAISEREKRYGFYEDKLSEMLEQDMIMIDTHGAKIGQINGLAVLDADEYAFAMPVRITATTYVGKAGIINIEQEAEMSGSIHDKGVQVLSGYLGQTYAQSFPLSLSCRVCFEQNYSGIDGDSASSTELYAILSSLSGLPINQELAVTGSINQRGEIQPIGGVSCKIEGFFKLCEKRGLTGAQGVIIPVQNAADLTLNDEVVQAVKEGMFHIYPIRHIDEGIELLTGVAAGARDGKGKYPIGTVHDKTQKKLRDFYKKSSASE